jgi:hypothetical protein
MRAASPLMCIEYTKYEEEGGVFTVREQDSTLCCRRSPIRSRGHVGQLQRIYVRSHTFNAS